MKDYKTEINDVAKAARYGVLRFVPLFIGVVAGLFLLGFALRSCGLIGSTVVERKVFEESYQRSEALKSQIATDEATIANIEGQLRNPNLDEDTRYNLEAQKRAAETRINAAKAKQE